MGESNEANAKWRVMCPVSLDVASSPVMTVLGNVYDRSSIEAWLSTRSTDPLTGEQLPCKTLIDVDTTLIQSEEALHAECKARRRATGMWFPGVELKAKSEQKLRVLSTKYEPTLPVWSSPAWREHNAFKRQMFGSDDEPDQWSEVIHLKAEDLETKFDQACPVPRPANTGWGYQFVNLSFRHLCGWSRKGLSFMGADLSHSTFEGCSFARCDFTGANLQGTTFLECVFWGEQVGFLNARTDTDTTFARCQVEGLVSWKMHEQVKDVKAALSLRLLSAPSRVL